MEQHSVEAALLALSSVDTDYARDRNGIGFNGRDTAFGNSLAKQVSSGRTLSPKQYGTAYRMLRTYKAQLSRMGVEYEKIAPPGSDKAPKETQPKQAKLVDFRGGFFTFSFPYVAEIKDDLKDSIPGRRWDGDAKIWTAPTDFTAVSAVGKFAIKHGFKITPAALAVIENVVPEAKPAPVKKVAKTSTEKARPINVERHNPTWKASWATDAELDIELGKELLPFQRAGVRYALDNIKPGKGIYIGDEMGLGKTPQSLAVLHAKKAYPALIAMPRVVWLKWAKELQDWTPGLKVVLLAGRIVGNKTRKIAERYDATVVKLGQPVPAADVYLIKYSVLHKWVKPKSRKVGNSAHKKVYFATGALKDVKLDAIVLDEAHFLKEEKSQRTQAALGITETAKPAVRLALSGTSMPNRHRELLPMLKLLDRLSDVAKSEWDYLNFFCNPNGYGVEGHFGYEWDGSPNGGELNRRMRSSFYAQHEKLDRVIDGIKVPGVLPDLPPIIPNFVPAELENPDRYDDVQTRLDEKKEQYSNAMRSLERAATEESKKKLRAICKGLENEVGVLSNEARKVVGEEKIKFDIEYVEDWLNSTDGKVIVFGHHREVNETIANHFNAPIIYGGTTDAQRDDAENRFNNDPGCRILVAQINAAGLGWNGTAASDVCFVEFPYVWSDLTQAVGRVYGRISDVHGVNVTYIVAPDTIDDHVIDDILEEKKKVQKDSVGGS